VEVENVAHLEASGQGKHGGSLAPLFILSWLPLHVWVLTELARV